MTDQALPNFDEAQTDRELPSPRKPHPRPTRRPAKKSARRVKVPVAKPAKRVPKKRRVRKNAPPVFHLPPQPTTRVNEPLLTSKEFDVTLQIFRILGEFDPQIRKRMLARLQGVL